MPHTQRSLLLLLVATSTTHRWALCQEVDMQQAEQQYQQALQLRCAHRWGLLVHLADGVPGMSLQQWAAHACSWRCACRAREDASNKQLRQAAALLKQAAGMSLAPSLEVLGVNATDAGAGEEADGSSGEGHAAAAAAVEEDVLGRPYPGLDIAEGAHLGALKELAVCYELGAEFLHSCASAHALPPRLYHVPSHLLA
jgi:hypothetical protein